MYQLHYTRFHHHSLQCLVCCCIPLISSQNFQIYTSITCICCAGISVITICWGETSAGISSHTKSSCTYVIGSTRISIIAWLVNYNNVFWSPTCPSLSGWVQCPAPSHTSNWVISILFHTVSAIKIVRSTRCIECIEAVIIHFITSRRALCSRTWITNPYTLKYELKNH